MAKFIGRSKKILQMAQEVNYNSTELRATCTDNPHSPPNYDSIQFNNLLFTETPTPIIDNTTSCDTNNIEFNTLETMKTFVILDIPEITDQISDCNNVLSFNESDLHQTVITKTRHKSNCDNDNTDFPSLLTNYTKQTYYNIDLETSISDTILDVDLTNNLVQGNDNQAFIKHVNSDPCTCANNNKEPNTHEEYCIEYTKQKYIDQGGVSQNFVDQEDVSRESYQQTVLEKSSKQQKIYQESDDEHHSKYSNETSNSESETEDANKCERKRKKRHDVNEKTWKKNDNKRKRELGEEYFGKQRTNEGWNYRVPKNKRTMKSFCACKKSLAKKSINCTKFTEAQRQQIFDRFWTNMTWEQRKIYVTLLVERQEIKRSRNRKIPERSRRTYTWIYYLKKQDEEEKFRVCKNMFLNTLGLRERTVIDWKNSEVNYTDDSSVSRKVKNAKLEGTNLGETISNVQDRKEYLQYFFNGLTKVESHYCRANSSKLYLEPNWISKSALYKFYKVCANEHNTRPVSIALFHHIFEEMNLSLFSPKKDECDKCVAYRTHNLSEQEYSLHRIKKNEAREAKACDKESDNKVFCMDMQSVLLSPKSNVSSLYFKQKLCVHNFTVYDMKKNDGYCFIWHEAAGGVTSNDYSSILCYFLERQVVKDLQSNQKIIIYSDGCTSQNRNSTLANALLNTAINNNVVIEQKYLEKGHTQMEADSMHSVIERQLRKTNINVPADYVGVCLKARENPRPYIVKYLNYEFFKDFSPLKFISSLRPGRTSGDPVVTDLRALKYCPDGSVNYKLRHPEEYRGLEFRSSSRNAVTSIPYNFLPRLYKKPIPIKKEKWTHLKALKESIEKDFHSFYDNLTHS